MHPKNLLLPVLVLSLCEVACGLSLSTTVFVDVGFRGSGSTSFTQENAEGDQDLIVVRELFYGEEGIDLSAYGLGSPDYVQSILFRPGPAAEGVTTGQSAGRIAFSGATILGFIIGTPPFGPDPLLMGSNSIFGITDFLLQDGLDPELK